MSKHDKKLSFHRGLAMLRVIEYFTKSLKVNNGMTLKYGLGLIHGHWKWHHSIIHRSCTSSYWRWIVTIALSGLYLSCIVSEVKQDIGRKWQFFMPHIHIRMALCNRELHARNDDISIRCPCYGVQCPNNAILFGMEKLMEWLPKGKKYEDMFSHFEGIPACDRWTDRQADILWQHSLHDA